MSNIKSNISVNITTLHASAGWSDIGYSFLVGGDGRVYEGRGWGTVGAHTRGYNSNGIAISFVGNFMTQKPNQAMLNAAQKLIACGIKMVIFSLPLLIFQWPADGTYG